MIKMDPRPERTIFPTEESLMSEKEKAAGFRLRADAGYFTDRGNDVIAFQDIYPEGHQGGGSSRFLFLVLAVQDLLRNP